MMAEDWPTVSCELSETDESGGTRKTEAVGHRDDTKETVQSDPSPTANPFQPRGKAKSGQTSSGPAQTVSTRSRSAHTPCGIQAGLWAAPRLPRPLCKQQSPPGDTGHQPLFSRCSSGSWRGPALLGLGALLERKEQLRGRTWKASELFRIAVASADSARPLRDARTAARPWRHILRRSSAIFPRIFGAWSAASHPPDSSATSRAIDPEGPLQPDTQIRRCHYRGLELGTSHSLIWWTNIGFWKHIRALIDFPSIIHRRIREPEIKMAHQLINLNLLQPPVRGMKLDEQRFPGGLGQTPVMPCLVAKGEAADGIAQQSVPWDRYECALELYDEEGLVRLQDDLFFGLHPTGFYRIRVILYEIGRRRVISSVMTDRFEIVEFDQFPRGANDAQTDSIDWDEYPTINGVL
ncbi:hypothetical protein PTTG_12459 [Puccinia triticina 1-1 BBBD Race 1]|uniref:Velvet domain-containing protein n=1 Tax=Puccinia triticina (isolate 1-1 / race 1 (BBBD)) TaxID=630390 RepID=A0A180GGC6_PUCT1|nr:hypothetical protein PTTG_12459 [Puccinia triticina 1-1 BBBD Race 1]